jgi:hypothetical protein
VLAYPLAQLTKSTLVQNFAGDIEGSGVRTIYKRYLLLNILIVKRLITLSRHALENICIHHGLDLAIRQEIATTQPPILPFVSYRSTVFPKVGHLVISTPLQDQGQDRY